MIDIKPSIATGWGKGQLYPILKELQQFSIGTAGLQGEVFFADSNTGYDGNDGSTWDKAFKTVAAAITKSEANRGRYTRNTIFIRGDFDETLSAFPSKCDLIGVGTKSHYPMARIIGTQVPTSTGYGTRLINIWWEAEAASPIITFTAAGTHIINCWFKAIATAGTTTATHAITIDNPIDVLIQGCSFTPNLGTPFSTAAIALTSAGGATDNCRIIGNDIYGAIGIHITAPVGSYQHCLIKDNFIHATTFCVDDNSNQWHIVGNRMITLTTKAGGYDYNAALACDNVLTGSDGSQNLPLTDQE